MSDSNNAPRRLYTVVISATREQAETMVNSLMHRLEITSVGKVTAIMRGDELARVHANKTEPETLQ